MAVSQTARMSAAAVLGLIAAADVLAMAAWFSASAVVPALAVDFSISPAMRGWVTGAVQLGFVTGAIGSAAIGLADAVETRALIRTGTAIAVLANAAILLAHGATALLALRFVTGFGLALVYPPSVRLIAAWFSGSRGLATGIAVGALTLGSFAPHLLTGAALSWQSVIACASALGIFAIPLISLVPPGSRITRAARFDVRAIPQVLRNRAVVLADVGYWGHMWELYAVWAWGPLFYAASLQAAHFRAPAGAIAFAAFGLSGAAGCVLAGVLGDRFGRATVAGCALLVSGAISVSIGAAFGSSPWLVTLLLAVWGFSVVADSAQFSTAITELAEPQLVGTALTLQMGAGFFITLFSIWLVGVVQASVGWTLAFVILGVGPAAGVLAMWRLRRYTFR